MTTFESMDLFAPLKRALAEQRYETPTPIQAQTIPPAIAGEDILGCAQTGTGKTAAFALPILDYLGNKRLRAAANRPLALVLAPTRELAIQISASFRVYGKHLRVRQALVYGGVGQKEQVNAVRRGAEVLIATPGRLLDLIDQGHIDLRDVQVFVLDEADRMLDMGFLPALKKIIANLPDQRQSLFFSATLPPKICNFAKQLLVDPVSVNVTPKSTSVKQIEQTVRIVDRGSKLSALTTVLADNAVDRSIVFTRTKHGANALARKLDQAGIRTAVIHGNKSQNARQQALTGFRQKRVRVLVATDVAARGIDIDGVSHVINYDMPTEPESYVHRIGRTGRAGAKGIAISFCTSDERRELRAIETLIGQKLRIQNPQARFASDPPAETKQRGARKPAGNGRTRTNRNKRGKSVPPQARRGKTTRGSRGKSKRQHATAS